MKRLLLLLLVLLVGCKSETVPIAVTSCRLSDEKAEYEVTFGAREDTLVQVDEKITMDLSEYYPDDREQFVKKLKESKDYDEVYYDDPMVVLLSRKEYEETKSAYYSIERTLEEYTEKGFKCE